jgi:hypothetical protein
MDCQCTIFLHAEGTPDSKNLLIDFLATLKLCPNESVGGLLRNNFQGIISNSKPTLFEGIGSEIAF